MEKNSIRNVLGCMLGAVLLLSGCSSVTPVSPIEVRRVEIPQPAPIVPDVDVLNLRPVSWILITPTNVDEKVALIKNGELVIFAVTEDGYKNIATNLSDIRASIQQYNQIIAVYKRQFQKR